MDASDFVLGGFASVGATFFTNPIEVSMRFDKVITTTLTMLIDSIEMDDCFCFFFSFHLRSLKHASNFKVNWRLVEPMSSHTKVYSTPSPS